MKTIILSAFKKFGDYTANSTELVAERLDGFQVGDFVIHSILFSAEIPEENRGIALFSTAQKLSAKGIISLGMASEKTGLCIEQVVTNKIHNTKYCHPSINETAIDVNRPYGEQIRMRLRPWNLSLFKSECARKNISIMPDSKDTGGFCCNHLAYQARVAQIGSEAWSEIPFIFIHTPCSPETLLDVQKFYSSGKTTKPVEEISEGIRTLILNAKL